MNTDTYFAALSSALDLAGIHRPSLVLDLDRLDGNISVVKECLAPNLALRLVDKSLPSLPLLKHLADACGTDRIMTFHLPVTGAVLAAMPAATVLLGKPMPVAAARQALSTGVLRRIDNPLARITWLVDTDERLSAYGELAEQLGQDFAFCFEVDVGLHRGGYPGAPALSRALEQLKRYPRLKCRGIMAYEAQINRIPGLLGGPKKALAKTRTLFGSFVACLGPDQRSILNIGGSSTALLYDPDIEANDVSLGSAFLLPGDFDVPSLARLKPPLFIAAPVLKVVDPILPGLDKRTWIMQMLGLAPKRGCYLYGGKWMAEPVHPDGMKTDKMFGLSSNQQFMALPAGSTLKPDDFAFLRPTQSESVLQQFGSLVVYSKGTITAEWETLPPA
ncbi:alanine racemase [Phyllobacterium endophyticum]|uniref:alanine racemase n=1 Tax=Phyllobacterium endophyticum TaxID=1149773 RepID=UPI0011CCD24A|nr:alanine racemase [Phyllobacterium endophyticum]TXR47563.1 DSD1 family PLP-dependent enzyme [Phyllobacterium endophyticum]